MFKLINFNNLDSTNKYALDHFSELAQNDVIVADIQTAGRGRLGRTWFSPPQTNLYFSIIIKETTGLPANFLTIIAALSLQTSLKKLNLEPQLKWPNDILLNNKKVCGILAETNKLGSVIGIGLNVNMEKSDLAKIDKPATSLYVETAQKFDRAVLLNDILNIFFHNYAKAKQNPREIFELWQKELNLIGKNIQVDNFGKITAGKVIKLDNQGNLVLETPSGQEIISAGDLIVS